jgi:hypothetical protein
MPAKKATPVTAAVSVPAAAPVKEEKPVKAAPAPTPVAAAPVEAAPVETVAEDTTSPLSVLEEKLSLLLTTLKEAQLQVKLVKKDLDRLRRVSDRVERKRANARTTPNGFAKPTQISPELCEFLGVAKNTEKARTDVTREIHKYVQSKDLSDPKNKRIILAHKDPVLKKLLGVTDKDEVTYFNLQRYLKRHFVKAGGSA